MSYHLNLRNVGFVSESASAIKDSFQKELEEIAKTEDKKLDVI